MMKSEGGAKQDLRQRTRQFALRAIRLVDSLPRRVSADVLGKQLVRSSSSVGANYRSARRARSNKEFMARLGVVEEEADESGYWIELIRDAGLMPAARVASLLKEADELVAIMVASIKTARKRGE